MDITEYRETYERFRLILGPTVARQITDQLDADRIKANRKEAKRLAKEELIRQIIREEMAK